MAVAGVGMSWCVAESTWKLHEIFVGRLGRGTGARSYTEENVM